MIRYPSQMVRTEPRMLCGLSLSVPWLSWSNLLATVAF
jgi:hypothetical protein